VRETEKKRKSRAASSLDSGASIHSARARMHPCN
jgi:hypothetical protein